MKNRKPNVKYRRNAEHPNFGYDVIAPDGKVIGYVYPTREYGKAGKFWKGYNYHEALPWPWASETRMYGRDGVARNLLDNYDRYRRYHAKRAWAGVTAA